MPYNRRTGGSVFTVHCKAYVWCYTKCQMGAFCLFKTYVFCRWTWQICRSTYKMVKWKWFTWAMKKHNFSWGPATHGSKFHRALGSIGNRKPKRTHRGKKMHGHHWDIKVTLKKVPVELVNKEISVIWVRGAVPGGRNSYVNIVF